MEAALNFAWLTLALWIFWQWLRLHPRGNGEWRAQLVGLALLILILLPVISISDDLLAAQSPAEVDITCVGRDHPLANAHAAVNPVPIFPDAAPIDLPASAVWPAPGGERRASYPYPPALQSIQNRPPPMA
jgi:hypothetical protein